jgi:hypothetical protein
LDQFFKKQSISNFDLVILDRVLFCISNKEIKKILKVLSRHAKMIFIDDFYEDQNKSYIGGWKHRNWVRILNEYGFELKFNKKTIYSKVENSNPRSMLFLKGEF